MAKKQKWQAGENFLVPLKDGTFAQGQVVISAMEAMNSALCVFSSARYHEKPLFLHAPKLEDSIAVLFVTRDWLDSGRWQVVSNEPNVWSADYINFDTLEEKGFVGSKIIGSAIVENFLNAFHCLEPWNDFHDPRYLDGLLLSPNLKPATVFLVPHREDGSS
jgi:hypothetical protein